MIADLKFEPHPVWVNNKWLFAKVWENKQVLIGVATPNRAVNEAYPDTPYTIRVIRKTRDGWTSADGGLDAEHFDELMATCILVEVGRRYGFITD